MPGERFVVCAQNHDQVGNRAKGERLSALVDFESLKLAGGAVLFSPFLPLIFMGEEYGETAPFQYFTSHGEPALIEAVRRGRREEFAAFRWHEDVPDPQDEETFFQSRLTPQESQSLSQRLLRKFYRELIRIRRRTPALSHLAMDHCRATPLAEQTLLIERWCDGSEVLLLLHFSERSADLTVSHAPGQWAKVIHSADGSWDGPANAPVTLRASDGRFHIALSPRSFVLYERC